MIFFLIYFFTHITDQIAAFQGHHVYPWTIAAREFSNNLYRLTYPTIPQLIALLLLPIPPLLTTFYGSFLFLVVASQETHRQAHMIRPARWARTLQKLRLIVSQRMHASHHRGAFDDNYCILSGHCNWILDRVHFFRFLEGAVYKICGAEPQCWQLNPALREEALSIMKMLRMHS